MQLHALYHSVLCVAACWFILYRLRSTGYLISLLAFPGTFLHELAHFVVGFILGAHPVSLMLLPRKEGHRWIYGSVSFCQINVFNGLFVALAPALLLPLASRLFSHFVLPAASQGELLPWIGYSYVTANLVFSGLPSRADIRVALPSLIFYGGLALLAWLLYRQL